MCDCANTTMCLPTFILMLATLSIFILHQVSAICVPEEAYFGGSSRQEGHLLGHMTDEYTDTRSLVDCVAICGRYSGCSSVNYALETGGCELNTEIIATAQVGDFASNENMVYIERLPMWLQWGAWGACSTTCADGTQTRSRTCCGPGANPVCVGSDTETQSCNLATCPAWGTWGSWGACSRCGQSRSRVCEDPDGTGVDCVGANTDSRDCNVASCYYRGCGGTISDYAATFGLTSYVNNYGCSWNIQVESGKRIELQFQSLHTEASYDRVTLYLGHGSPIFSGSSIPSAKYTSSSNTMSVNFASDGSIYSGYTGFVLFYKTVV